jgi:hypothetical protein
MAVAAVLTAAVLMKSLRLQTVLIVGLAPGWLLNLRFTVMPMVRISRASYAFARLRRYMEANGCWYFSDAASRSSFK